MGNIKVTDKNSSKEKELIARMNDKINGKENKSETILPPTDNLSSLREQIEQLEKTPDKYEMVNHPSHYNNYDVEVVDMMERIWGREATATWCKMTAFKYRMRMGTKPGSTLEEDLKKEKWYLNKANELSK